MLKANHWNERAMRLRIWIVIGVVSLMLICVAGFEFRYAWLQSKWISDYASQLHYQVDDGESEAIRFPDAGPFNQRLGYSAIPQLQSQLQQQGYGVARQARFSSELMDYAEHGLF